MCAPSALLLLSSFLLLRHVLPLFSVGYGALLGRSFRKLLPMLDQHISSLAARIVAGIGMTRHQTDVGWHCADKKLRRPVSEAASYARRSNVIVKMLACSQTHLCEATGEEARENYAVNVPPNVPDCQ